MVHNLINDVGHDSFGTVQHALSNRWDTDRNREAPVVVHDIIQVFIIKVHFLTKARGKKKNEKREMLVSD